MKFIVLFALLAAVASAEEVKAPSDRILLDIVGAILANLKPQPIEVGPAIVDIASPVVVDNYQPIVVGPAVVDSISPVVVDQYQPISVGPAVVDSISPVVVDQYQPIVVGPAVVDSISPVVVDQYQPIVVGPAVVDSISPVVVDQYQPIVVGPAVVDNISPVVVDQYQPVVVEPAVVDSLEPSPVSIVEPSAPVAPVFPFSFDGSSPLVQVIMTINNSDSGTITSSPVTIDNIHIHIYNNDQTPAVVVDQIFATPVAVVDAEIVPTPVHVEEITPEAVIIGTPIIPSPVAVLPDELN